jgi:hypothetical protein
MIETFRLHQLLRETVTSPYCCMVTRPTGAAIRGRIERALAESGCVTALLDFDEVELIDFSCADEVVAKLLLGGAGAGPYFVLRGLRRDQVEAVEHVLRHHGLAVTTVSEPAERAEVLGCANQDAREAFGSVRDDGPADEEMLADRLGWARERASGAFEALTTLRLARLLDGALHPVPLP